MDMINHTRTNRIPPRVFPNPKKLEDKKFRKSYMDAFEVKGLRQVEENIAKYNDFYRMVDGDLTYIELKDYAPSLEFVQDIFDIDDIDLPTNIYHYDLIGRIINAFVGKLTDLEDKFFVTDTGEIAENEFIKEIDKILQASLQDVVDRNMRIGMIKNGINPDTNLQFETEEEEQQYQQQMAQIQEEFVPREAIEDLKKSFKTTGAVWAEKTLERDEELLNFKEKYQELFKHFLLTGDCASITRIIQGRYVKSVLDRRKVFHSGDTGKKYLKNYEYAGWIDYLTPNQVIEQYGEELSPRDVENILGGKDGKFKDTYNTQTAAQSVDNVANGLIFKRETHPFKGYRNYKYVQHLEDMSGMPLGFRRHLGEDGGYYDERIFTPRGDESGFNTGYANIFNGDYSNLPEDVCQVTEVYFRGYEYMGYLYTLDEDGIPQMDIITKDISPEFLKENNIKQIYDESINQGGDKNYINTVVWQYKPYVYRGVKIQSSRLKSAMYPIFEKMEYQISDETDTEVTLPMTGIITKMGIAKKLEPFQMGYNASLNQLRHLEEKELGMFFTVEMESLPTEIREQGDVADSLMRLRNMAKQIGMAPTISNSDDRNGMGNHRNLFGVHNISHAQEMRSRIEIAEYYESKAYQTVGLIMQKEMSDTKYTNTQGLKLSNETMSNQIAILYETFNNFIKDDKIQHLNIAQFMQMLGYDDSIYFTKSDSSIEWIKLTKEMQIPWRKLGITVTEDSKKRQKFEELKQYILNNNTMGSDLLAIGKAMTADNFTSMLQIGIEERDRADQIRQQGQAHAEQLVQREAEHAMERQQAELEAKAIKEQKDRDSREYIAEITAMARAVGKSTDEAGLEELRRVKSEDQRDKEISIKQEVARNNAAFKQQDLQERERIKQRELEIEERKLELREKKIEADKYIASVNKN